jgi:hypothetical protein
MPSKAAITPTISSRIASSATRAGCASAAHMPLKWRGATADLISLMQVMDRGAIGRVQPLAQRTTSPRSRLR